MYAFGIVLNFMFTKLDPNEELGITLYKVMSACTSGRRPSLAPDCPEDIAELIVCCWDEDPLKRPSDFTAILAALESGFSRINSCNVISKAASE